MCIDLEWSIVMALHSVQTYVFNNMRKVSTRKDQVEVLVSKKQCHYPIQRLRDLQCSREKEISLKRIILYIDHILSLENGWHEQILMI